MPTPAGSIIIEVHADDTPISRTLASLNAKTSKSVSSALRADSIIQPLGRITGKASEFQKSMEAANARVIAFGASMGRIRLANAAFDKLVESTIQVEKQLADINSLFNLSSRSLQSFSNSLFQVANQMGVAFSDAAKAASVFAHHGLSVEETLKRTSAALALSRLSSIGFEESVMSLTATINSFTKESLDATEVVDRLIGVGGKYAASADEIAEGLRRVAASANDANVSFNQTIALITAAQQVTARGGSVIGNSLKSIFTRLERPKVLDDLESAGVQVRNLSGQILPMDAILKNLAVSYDTLASAQKSFVSETVGGVYQINVLKAIFGDLKSGASAYEGALKTASNSAGTAERRLQILNGTISSQLIRSMNELTRASANVGNALLAPGAKSGIGGFEKILKIIGDITDKSNESQGSVASQSLATVSQGAVKGLGNFLQGPGVQFVVFTLLKLFQKLGDFISESAKDMSGLNAQEKQRLAINESLATFLREQKDLLKGVLDGTTSANTVAEAWLGHIQKINAEMQAVATVSKSIGATVNNKVSIKTAGFFGAAQGHVPNLYSEVEAAKNGGYNAGQVVNTMVRGASGYESIIANSAETRATLYGHGGKPYDFINPPASSEAGRKHRAKAMARLGIDPYNLPQTRIAAEGDMPDDSMLGLVSSMRSHYNQMTLRHHVIAAADNFVKTNSTVSKMRGTSWDREFLVAALTNGAMGKKVGNDANILQKTMGISPSMLEVLTEGFKNQMGYGELEKRINMGEFAGGKVPNLAFTDVIKKLQEKKIPTDYQKRFNKATSFDLSWVPENLSLAMANHLGADEFVAYMKSFSRKVNMEEKAPEFFKTKLQNPETLAAYLVSITSRSSGLAALRSNETRSTNTSIIDRIVSDTFGINFISKLQDKQLGLKDKNLPPELIQQMLNRYGPTFKTVTAYQSTDDLRIADEKHYKDSITVPGPSNTKNIYSVPVSIHPHKTFLDEYYLKNLEEFSKRGEYSGLASAGEFGPSFGADFDAVMKNRSRKEGLEFVNPNSSIDIAGFPKHIASATNITGAVSGIETKSTLYEAAKKGRIAAKIYRTLAGNDSSPIVRGPRENVPKLEGIPAFQAKAGGIGILDYDHYGEDKTTFNNAIYAAVAKGKALKVLMGPFGSGQSTYAAKTANQFNAPETDAYIKTMEDVDKFNQVILATSARVGIHRKVLGIAFAAASQVQDIRPKGFVQSEKQRGEYDKAVENLKKKLGSRFVSAPIAGEGLVPNLVTMADINQRHPQQEFENLSELTLDNLKALKAKTARGHDWLLKNPETVDRDKLIMHGLSKHTMYNDEIKRRLGYINSPVAIAMAAENKATGGHATLAASGLLSTPDNPRGYVAIDQRHQRNAQDAINQHMAMGQTLSQLKTMRSAARGAVPNLAIDSGGLFDSNSVSSSVLLAISSFGTQVASTLPIIDNLKLTFSKFVSAQEINSINIRKLNKTYADAQDELIRTGKTVYEGNVYRQTAGGGALTALEDAHKAKIKTLETPEQKAYEEQSQSTRDRISARGRSVAWKSAIFGGIASEIVGRFSPRGGAATSELVGGLQFAGQAATAFPNKFGTGLGTIAIGASIASAIDVWSKGLQNARRDYEVSQSKFQALSTQIDVLTNALSSFDTLVNDSAISFETLVREERKYTEALGQLGSTPEGQKALSKVAGATSDRERISKLQEYKEIKAREQERAANLLNIKEYASNRTFNAFGKVYGSSALGYSNPVDKSQVNQLIRSTAASAITSLDNDSKNTLLRLADTPDKFQDAINEIPGDFKDFLSDLTRVVGTQNLGKITEAIRGALATEHAYTSPEGTKALAGLQERNSTRQGILDAAARREATTRRLFVNQGALKSSNALDIFAQSEAGRFAGEQVGFAQKQAVGSLYQQQYGEGTVQSYLAQVDIEKTASERRHRIAELANKTTRSVSDLFGQSFDEYANEKATGASKLGAAGTTGFANLPQWRTDRINALNEALEKTVKQTGGDFTKFNTNGVFDQNKFTNAFTQNAPAKYRTDVSNFITSNSSIDILKNMQSASNELVSINLEANQKTDETNAKLEGIKSEINFKQLSNFMGGIKNFLDRGSRRESERSLIKGTYLLRHGTTAETRGQGGAAILDYFKKSGTPIDLTGNSPLSKLMVEAWQASQAGIVDVFGKSTARVADSISRSNGAGDTTTKGFLAYARGQDWRGAATAQLQSEFKPENSQILKDSSSAIDASTKVFRDGLTSSSDALYRFAGVFDTSAGQLKDAIANLQKVKEATSKATSEDTKKVESVIRRELDRQAYNTKREQNAQEAARLHTTGIGQGLSDLNPFNGGDSSEEHPWAHTLSYTGLAVGLGGLYAGGKYLFGNPNAPKSRARLALGAAGRKIGGLFGRGRNEEPIIYGPHDNPTLREYQTYQSQQAETIKSARQAAGPIHIDLNNYANRNIRSGPVPPTTRTTASDFNRPVNVPPSEYYQNWRYIKGLGEPTIPHASPIPNASTIPSLSRESRRNLFRQPAIKGLGVGALDIIGQTAASGITNPYIGTAASLGSSYAANHVLQGGNIFGASAGNIFGASAGSGLAASLVSAFLPVTAGIVAAVKINSSANEAHEALAQEGEAGRGLGYRSQQAKQFARSQTNLSSHEQSLVYAATSGNINKLSKADRDGSRSLLNKQHETKVTQDNKDEQAAIAAQQKNTEMMENLSKALEKIASGNVGAGGQNASPIKVDISVKDSGTTQNEIFQKVIEPLQRQLNLLQSQTNILMNEKQPQPAKVGG